MTIFQAFLQGILQGFTEFLPVSSSGHLSLFQYFTGNSGESAFLFSILLHTGTLVAVCIVFWRTILALIMEVFYTIADLFSRQFSVRRMPPTRRTLFFMVLSLLPLGLMLLVKDQVSGFSTDNDITVEGFCFLITSALLLFSSRAVKNGGRNRKTGENITSRDALTIGFAQLFATMPGISRSGSTISAGLMCGLSQSYVVSYSFILGIPAVLGAILLEVKDAATSQITLPLPILLTGFFTAVVFGILSIKLVQWIVRDDKLKYFGWYTMVLGLLVIVVGYIDKFGGYPSQHFFSSL